MKILAIDDSPTLRKFISKHLAAYSDTFEVSVAATGEEGVNSALAESPDVILLDFILPDFNGDEVCRRLLEDKKTAAIPVILMSSSTPDVEKNEGEFENIVRSMIKPFSPQLLCASVSSVLKKAAAKPVATESTPGKTESNTPATASKSSITPAETKSTPKENILFCGKASYFPVYEALLGIEEEQATGILHLELSSGDRQVYFRAGKPVLVSTHKADLYMSCGKLDIPEESKEYFETAKKNQRDTGKPAFLQMVEDGYLPQDQVNSFTNQFGNVLFAEIWTTPHTFFKFVTSDSLPDFVPDAPLKETMLHWMTTTLRNINPDNPAVSSIAKPEDILSFTAEGYQKIQTFSLTEEEISIIKQLGEGNANIGQIAKTLNLQWHNVCRILFLFKKTNIIDIWPTAA